MIPMLVNFEIWQRRFFDGEAPSAASIESTVTANLPGLDLKSEPVEQVPRTIANKWRPVVSQVTFKKGAE
ncbi:MAG: hypothetical protein L0220_25270 [Acidobacteria bacterium]|nr:hypothetical protein [Acidobacteriota bacterium]